MAGSRLTGVSLQRGFQMVLNKLPLSPAPGTDQGGDIMLGSIDRVTQGTPALRLGGPSSRLVWEGF